MLLIRLDEPSARAQYAVRHLLSRFTGWAVEFAGSEEEFRSSALPKFRYGNPVPGETEVVAMQASGGMGAKGEVPRNPLWAGKDCCPFAIRQSTVVIQLRAASTFCLGRRNLHHAA